MVTSRCPSRTLPPTPPAVLHFECGRPASALVLRCLIKRPIAQEHAERRGDRLIQRVSHFFTVANRLASPIENVTSRFHSAPSRQGRLSAILKISAPSIALSRSGHSRHKQLRVRCVFAQRRKQSQMVQGEPEFCGWPHRSQRIVSAWRVQPDRQLLVANGSFGQSSSAGDSSAGAAGGSFFVSSVACPKAAVAARTKNAVVPVESHRCSFIEIAPFRHWFK